MAALPLDVLPIILSHLAIPDILRVRLVCNDYLHVTRSHTLWYTYIHQHFLRHNIPIPGLDGRSFEALDARTLEALAIKAERYRRNWISEEPTATRNIQFTAVPDSRIIALKFLSRHGEHWLMSLSMTRSSDMRVFTLQCWDLKYNPPVCIARRIFHHFTGLTFNKLLTGRAVVAVMTPECVGFFPSCCLAALTCRGVPLRICLIDIDPIKNIQTGVDGDGGNGSGTGRVGPRLPRTPAQACVNVATLEDRAAGNLTLVGDLVLTQDDVGRTFLYHFEAPQEKVELIDPERTVQPERVMDILVDRNCIILARTTTVEIYPLPASFVSCPQIEPIGRHKWQWKVDSISLVGSTDTSGSVSPIQLVLRYRGIHPWPVNFIHRYVLNLSDSFNPYYPASKHNFPYALPPVNIQMIGSPIRIMATYDMAVGSHGTIIYIDSHTESYFGHSDFGQRLAGTHIDEWSGEGGGEQVGTVTRESSVYQVSERDEWTRIALQEEEGRIAIGHADGRITLLDYA